MSSCWKDTGCTGSGLSWALDPCRMAAHGLAALPLASATQQQFKVNTTNAHCDMGTAFAELRSKVTTVAAGGT